MSIAILISDAFFSRMSVCLFMIVECGVPLAHSTTHDIYRNYCYLPLYCFCGNIPLLAQLRDAKRDASSGTVEALKKISLRHPQALWAQGAHHCAGRQWVRPRGDYGVVRAKRGLLLLGIGAQQAAERPLGQKLRRALQGDKDRRDPGTLPAL